MTSAAAWRWCAAAGVVAFICSWGFSQIPGLVACGPTGGLGPIIAFEFVRSTADVAALFGSEPCRSTFADAQRIGLLIDALAFIPAYTTFLILASMASARITTRWPPLAMLVAAAIGAAGLCDEIEGILLYRVLAGLPGTPALVDALWWPVRIKFALLGFASFGIAALLAAQRTPFAICVGAAVGIGALMALYGLVADPPDMMKGLAIAWTTLLFTALATSVRRSLFAGSDHRR